MLQKAHRVAEVPAGITPLTAGVRLRPVPLDSPRAGVETTAPDRTPGRTGRKATISMAPPRLGKGSAACGSNFFLVYKFV